MKTSFFVAAILGLVSIQQTQAVNLQSQEEFDFSDYDLAEILNETEGEGHAHVDTETYSEVPEGEDPNCF